MNANLLRRAILATSITLTLAASGIALSRGALGAATQAQKPVKYLPMIIGRAVSAAEQTATANAAATGTGVATATATATATSTSTSVATATSSPTSSTPVTVQLHIANATGWPLTFTLAGPTSASGSIDANQSRDLTIEAGHYTITAQTHCQTVPVEFDTVPDVPNDITYTCP